MSQSRNRTLVFLCALLLLAPLVAAAGGVPVSAQEPAPPPLAAAMPADVPLFVSTDFDLESDQYVQATALVAGLLLPGAGDRIAVALQRLASVIGVIPEDVQRVLNGQIGIGVLGARMADESRGDGLFGSGVSLEYTIVLHPNQAGTARQIVESWFTEQVEAQGDEPQRSQTGSVVMLTNPNPDRDSTLTAPAVVIFSGDYILLGADHVEMQPFVDATQNAIPTLAGTANLRTLVAGLPEDRLIFGYTSGEQLAGAASDLLAGSSLVRSVDPPFGATAFAIVAEQTGLRFESVSQPVVGSSPPSATSPANPDFATLLPDSTLAMITGNDLGESWLIDQVQKALLSFLMNSMGGGAIDLGDADLDAQFGMLSMLTGIDFKTDLMDQLHGVYGVALFSVDPENPLASSAVIASELADVDRVSVGVTSIGPLLQSAGAGLVSVTTASVAGQTVNNATLLDDSGAGPTIQYGVVNDRLMIGLGDGLSILAHPPADSLADDAAYQAALAALPAHYSSLVYVDPRAIAGRIASYLIDSLAASSTNPVAQCLLANSTGATPVAGTPAMGATTWAVCSIIGLLFGENWLQNFLVSRVPGPFVAVSYPSGGLQHVSGILLVNSDRS